MKHALIINAPRPSTTDKKELFDMIALQAKLLTEQYHTTCFEVKDLQKVLNIGESNAYELVRKGRLTSQKIGRRITIPVVSVAKFLVAGEKTP